MSTGTVKFFNTVRGFGFISNDEGGKDVYVHMSDIVSGINTSLAEGERVTFNTEEKDGKAKAISVSRIQ